MPFSRHSQALALATLSGLLGTVAVGPQPLLAQEGGRLLTFGLSERLEASTNPALRTDPDGGSLVSTTGLTFGYSDVTLRDRLSLDLATSLRAATGGEDVSAADPRLSFGYGRQGVNSSFGLDASFVQAEVGFLRPLDLIGPGAPDAPPNPTDPTDPADPDGVPDGTDDGDGVIDLGDLVGDGTRRDASVSTRLTLIEAGPLGVTLTARTAVTRYDEGASDSLEGSTRSRVGAAFRLRLGPTLDGRVRLGFARVEPEEDGARDTSSLGLGLSLDRPAGPFRLDLSLVDAEEGGRVTLGFGRTLALPLGNVSFSLGATRTGEGDVTLTGDLSASRQLPRDASFGVSARRNVTSTREGETVVSTLSANFDQPLTGRLGLSLNAGWVLTERTATDDRSEAAEAAAQVNLALTRDWSLGTGVSYRLREPEDGAGADETAVFLTLGRSFASRP